MMCTATPSRAYRARTGDAAVSSSACASSATSVRGGAGAATRENGEATPTTDSTTGRMRAGKLMEGRTGAGWEATARQKLGGEGGERKMARGARGTVVRDCLNPRLPSAETAVLR